MTAADLRAVAKDDRDDLRRHRADRSSRDTVTVFLVGAIAALVLALCFGTFFMWEKVEVLDLKIQHLSTQYEVLKDRTDRSDKR